MLDLQGRIRTIVEPLALGKFVSDWASRAAKVGAISDYYTIRRRDNPLFLLDDDSLGESFGSEATLRTALASGFMQAFESTSVTYAFPMEALRGEEKRIFEDHYGNVDSVEKMAMSVIADAIMRFDLPVVDLILLCGQFYEEALHLNALSSLFDIDQRERPWISPKREPFWRLARQSGDLREYVLVQNCLSEGEGAIAAAEIVFALSDMPPKSPAVRVANRILAEETNHALIGYEILHRTVPLDADASHRIICRFQEVEPLRPPGSAKLRRQHFALGLLTAYRESSSLQSVEDSLITSVDLCRRTGFWN